MQISDPEYRILPFQNGSRHQQQTTVKTQRLTDMQMWFKTMH